ncbi:MAG: hypothetical protein CMB80_19675 [Flammeovirgaceae bacterium]|nr:hypothetical protein [Flammeovirgaceae bacterium]|tara:strand:- start:74 stop:568 length:495 start_codon:yes stop_codon:yes gene_type:complete
MNYSKPSTKLLYLGCLSLFIAFASFNNAQAFTDPSKTATPKINSLVTQIYFDIDEKSPDAPSQVKKMVEELKALFGDQPLNIKITGRTCDLGDADYNEFLSKQRAYSVMDMLMMKGLNINYVEVDGVGEEDPIVPNTSIENRKKNRSVSVMVVAGGLDQYLAAL